MLTLTDIPRYTTLTIYPDTSEPYNSPFAVSTTTGVDEQMIAEAIADGQVMTYPLFLQNVELIIHILGHSPTTGQIIFNAIKA